MPCIVEFRLAEVVPPTQLKHLSSSQPMRRRKSHHEESGNGFDCAAASRWWIRRLNGWCLQSNATFRRIPQMPHGFCASCQNNKFTLVRCDFLTKPTHDQMLALTCEVSLILFLSSSFIVFFFARDFRLYTFCCSSSRFFCSAVFVFFFNRYRIRLSCKEISADSCSDRSALSNFFNRRRRPR